MPRTTDAALPSLGQDQRPPRRRPLVALAGTGAVTVLFVAGVLALTHGGADASGLLAAAIRFVRYAGSFVAVGGLVFLTVVRPPGMPVSEWGRRCTTIAAVTGIVATLLAVPVQAGYLSGDLGRSLDLATLRTVADSGFGASAAIALAGLVLLLLALSRVPAPEGVGVGGAACLLVLGAFLLTGHTATSEPRIVGMGANLAHTLAGAVWLGGLVLLPPAMAERRAASDDVGAARLVARFSTTATGTLLLVAAAGTALAWVEVRELAALATTYGAVLVAKVAVVAVVALLGAYNNRRLVPALRRGEAGWATRLQEIVRVEALLLVAVLAVTAVLVNIVPARVDAGVDAQVVGEVRLGAEHVFDLVVEPGRPGTNEVHLYERAPLATDGDSIDDVTIAFIPPGENEAESTARPAAVGPGHYLHLGGEMTSAGLWHIQVSAVLAGEPHADTTAIPVSDPSWSAGSESLDLD